MNESRHSRNPLAGNGVELVRERALAGAIQSALERLYQLERIVDVDPFMTRAEAGEREALLVREGDDGGLELSLRVPELARPQFDVETDSDLDPLCQLIEGVSHFVYISDRARIDREATQLELELQAEIDKYIVLVAFVGTGHVQTSATLRRRLYEDVEFTHEESSEHGERYRVANYLAGKFTRKLEREFLLPKRYRELRTELRRFYRMGQEGKLRTSNEDS